MATPIPTNQAEFRLDELVTVTGGTVLSPTNPGPFRGVSTDTRQIASGAIFVALSGERFDGHGFVANALSQGAALAVVEREVPVPITQLVVPDALTALGQIAGYHRRRWGGALIAIAGAAGKTTTRAATSALLEAAYGAAVHSTLGNLNNRIGVPMVLFGLSKEHQFGVIELGTNQTGEVPLLTAIVAPEVSILTLVDLEHAEGLGDLDAIEREEGAIFGDSCHTLVVNGDDPRAVRQAELARARAAGAGRALDVVSYGFGPQVNVRAESQEGAGTDGSLLSIRDGERSRQVRVPVVGRPACYAVLAATAAAEALTRRALDAAVLQAGLDSPSFKPEGRAEIVRGPHGEVIVNDSYNANPASMRAAVVTAAELAAQRGGSLHLVLGEMRELGAASTSAHAAMGEFLVGYPWSTLWTIGSEMAALVDAVNVPALGGRVVRHVASSSGVADELRPHLHPSDVILVKGSRGVRTEVVIAELLSQKVEA